MPRGTGDKDPRATCLVSQHVEHGGQAPPRHDRDADDGGGCGTGTRLRVVRGNRRHVRVAASSDGDGDWPLRTDQWCWHCCHPIAGQPLPMPIRHDDRRDIFHVMGEFCSWACMKAHNMSSSSYTKSVIANYITMFRHRCTGVLKGTPSAPPREALKVFGGTMSIEQFRAASATGVQHFVLPPKMIVHHRVVHEQQACQRAHAAAASLQARRAAPDLAQVVSFKDVSAKNETLRLKRPKPLQNNRNLLERSMGIGALVQTL